MRESECVHIKKSIEINLIYYGLQLIRHNLNETHSVDNN